MSTLKTPIKLTLVFMLMLCVFSAEHLSAQSNKQSDALTAHDERAKHDEHGNHDHEAMMVQEKKITAALATLSAEDQKLATAQRFCPMMPSSRLGTMGAPVKVILSNKPVFLCCNDCKKDAIAGGAKTVATAEKLAKATAVIATLPMEERMAIEAQKYCAIADGSLLGGMGSPVKLELNGKPVYLCCKGCVAKANADPSATLAKVEELKKAGMGQGHDHKAGDQGTQKSSEHQN